VDASTRQTVHDRAHGACEYCRLPQSAVPAIRFHVDHVLARQHGGKEELENLALACPNCNWNKGPNMTALEPETGGMEMLFNPRTQSWREHFELVDAVIRGLTSIGRATASRLRFNTPERVEVRRELSRPNKR
jgi:hypothetical protein